MIWIGKTLSIKTRKVGYCVNNRVLLLSGSPRQNGNTEILCQQFAKGAEDAGHQVELVRVHDLQIGACRACYACRTTKTCVQNDDMTALLEKLIAADVIVLATPVYFYTMDGQMKTMIDRTLPRYTEIADKEFYFIATAADGKETMERTMDGLYGFIDCLPGAKVKGKIYGAGVYQKGEATATKAMEQAYQYGKQC